MSSCSAFPNKKVKHRRNRILTGNGDANGNDMKKCTQSEQIRQIESRRVV